jgi:hypothetical protein
VAEREGFEPPIGLHLCRISSAAPQAGRVGLASDGKWTRPHPNSLARRTKLFIAAMQCRTSYFWVIRRYKFVTGQTSSSAAADLPIINY